MHNFRWQLPQKHSFKFSLLNFTCGAAKELFHFITTIHIFSIHVCYVCICIIVLMYQINGPGPIVRTLCSHILCSTISFFTSVCVVCEYVPNDRSSNTQAKVKYKLMICEYGNCGSWISFVCNSMVNIVSFNETKTKLRLKAKTERHIWSLVPTVSIERSMTQHPLL